MGLQQFDEFYETYGVAEGDGMYLDPDRRIVGHGNEPAGEERIMSDAVIRLDNVKKAYGKHEVLKGVK